MLQRSTTVEHDSALTSADELVRALNSASLEASIGEYDAGIHPPRWNVLGVYALRSARSGVPNRTATRRALLPVVSVILGFRRRSATRHAVLVLLLG